MLYSPGATAAEPTCLKTLKMELPCDSAISFLGIYPEKTNLKKKKMHPSGHSNPIYNSQDMEAT